LEKKKNASLQRSTEREHMRATPPEDSTAGRARRLRRWLWRAALATGAAGAGFVALGAGLAWAFLHNTRLPGSGTPADHGLSYEPVTLAAPDGVRLAAWYVPRAGAKAGVVVCHGYRATRQSTSWLLPLLHRAGFAVLTFDFRAMGESGGSACSFGYREKQDVRAAVEYLRRHAGLQAGRVGVWGHSLGGAAAILAAAEDPAIGAVVSDSAFARLDHMVRQRFSQLGRAGVPLADCTRWWGERMCGFSAVAVSPVAAAPRIAPRPLLIIHGERDTYTPPAQARVLYAAAADPKQLWIVPEATHTACHSTAPEEYERRVSEFVRQALFK
jgi:dipeptidyl aminopeptidase/acylaminoacyl peptidase